MIGPKNLRIGRLGEDIAVKYLKSRDFEIIERNYLRKWGEIDIICKKANIIHFVEVKTVSQVTGTQSGSDWYRPEDNFHNNKALRMKRIIETYIDEKDLNNDYRVDLITVKVNEIEAKARITFFDDVIL